MKGTSYIIILLFLIGCSTQKKSSYHSDTLSVKKINNALYEHTSYLQTEKFGKVPCNGLVFINGDEALVYDTPTIGEASLELINWIHLKSIKK